MDPTDLLQGGPITSSSLARSSKRQSPQIRIVVLSPLSVGYYQQKDCGHGCCYHSTGEVALPPDPEPHPSAHRQRLPLTKSAALAAQGPKQAVLHVKG
jgi:hypothetical protein